MGKRKRQRQDEGNHFTTAESLIGQTFFVDHPPAEEDGEAPRGGYGSQVLPVAELEGDWEGDPGDGSEYLSLVRRQAAGLLDIVTAPAPYPTPPPSASASTPKVPPPRAQLTRPTEVWRDSFIQGFKRVRRTLQEAGKSPHALDLFYLPLPNDEDESRWRSYIYGVKRDHSSRKPSLAPPSPDSDMELEDVDAEAKEAEEAKHRPKTPEATLLKLFTQTTVFAILEHFDVWIAERLSRCQSGPSTAFLPPALRRRGATAASTPRSPAAKKSAVDVFDTQWLFALLSVVDDLLAGDDIDRLRRLAKTCLAVLAAEDKVAMLEEETKAGLWMVVAAVSTTWGQRDLWQEV